MTSTAEFLTACRDIGAPRAVINTREDDDWLLSFRSQSRPLSTLYDNQRAITGMSTYVIQVRLLEVYNSQLNCSDAT